ncbi:protoporphyrinogen oxidase [Mycolicibacterium sp. GF69]|uniref:protoporphyrinogen oxidase n=1 Tax=Mycolicibacterium sp. GF69 TaxID=2267251 RepID=UPI000DCCDB90|nr:protoporphyrinogen oxidase [Mycolicibacterium sp. GF69]RAV13139.1 protoporphyrinogen oxidase [Mycolicibacterium sp. GF69]
MSMSYCVVGGGISGLVAAYRLRVAAGPDASITLFDPADRLGGVLRTERIAGQPMDVGAEAFVARRPEVPALLAELGMANRQVGTTGVRPLIYSQARLHPLPAGTLQGIPAQPSSLAGLVDDATVAWMHDERNRPFSWRPGADPSVAELVGDRFGGQVVTRSVEPLLAGVYAGSAATIGVRSAVPALAVVLDRGARSLTDAVREAVAGSGPLAVTGSVFGAVEGGYQGLVDELVRHAGARWLQVAVQGLARAPHGWELVDDEGARHRADAVVLAVPAPRLARLVADVAPRSAVAARRIPTASTAVVALALPGGTPLPQRSGVLVANGERMHAKAVTLTSRKWGPRGNVELVRLSFGRFGDELARSAGDEELLEWAAADLATLFGVRTEPVDHRVQRWIDAMPQYGPGHGDLTADLRAGLPPTIAVAGGFLDGIGVPACVASATRAAASLVTPHVAR